MPRLAGWEIGRVPGFYGGAGIPSAATLEAGDYLVRDYYVNTSTNTLYYCSTAGPASTSVWTAIGGGAGVAVTTLVQIATHDTVGAPEASFTFSGLNGDSDISYIIRGRWVKATAADVAMKVRPNNDATANYDSEFLYGQDNTPLAFKSAADNGLLLDYHLANAGISTFDAVLYAKTGFKRTMTTRGGSADSANTNYSAFAPQSSWRNTADNITSLVVVATTEIGVGSHFELWTPRAIHVVSNP